MLHEGLFFEGVELKSIFNVLGYMYIYMNENLVTGRVH